MMIIVIALFLITSTLYVNGAVLGKMRVKVVDSKGKPIKDVKITLQSMKVSTNIYNIKTKKNGVAVQNGLLNHQFAVTIEKEGYQTLKKVVKVRAGLTESEEITMLSNEEAVQKSIANDPHAQAINAFNKAAEFINKKDFDSAMEPLKKAISLDDGIHQAHFYLGYVYYEQGKVEESLAPLLKSIELKPDYSAAFRILAAAYEKLGKKEESAKYTKMAQEVGGKTPVDAYNDGIRAFNNGETENAIKFFTECLELDEKYADAYYRLGLCYLNKADNENAIANLKKYIEMKPDGSEVETAKAIIDSLK